MWFRYFFLVFVILLTGGICFAEEATYFSFDSSPDSWVGRGYTDYYVSPSTGWEITASGDPNSSLIVIDIKSLSGGAASNFTDYYWELRLASPYAEVLTEGFYDNASRNYHWLSTEPHLDFTGNGLPPVN